MSIYKGDKLAVDIFGESHGAAIGVVINGLPAGEKICTEKLLEFLKRRAPGKNPLSTARNEPDVPKFLSGVKDGIIGGTPICAVIENTDNRSGDYESLKHTPRPGHADYSAYKRFSGFADMRGGGHFSGRLTAPLCIAGGIAIQLLERQGIFIRTHIASVGHISDTMFADVDYALDSVKYGAVSVIDDSARKAIEEEILNAKQDGDSVGGTVECMICGMPAGKGGLIFEGIESRLSSVVFGIPAIKGIEFGNGFKSAQIRGSENNDPFYYDGGKIITKTNRHGGILGGISTGMPIVFCVAVKPTPSVSLEQNTVDLSIGKNTSISAGGRHDPCIVPRVLPCIEAAAAIVLLDLCL